MTKGTLRLVVWGLVLAKQAGTDVQSNTLHRAFKYLNQELVEEENHPDMQAWMLHALSAYHQMRNPKKAHTYQVKAFDNLWKNRSQLNAYTRALLALSAHHYGDRTRARTLVENLEPLLNPLALQPTQSASEHLVLP